jgi:replication factor C subunit 1
MRGLSILNEGEFLSLIVTRKGQGGKDGKLDEKTRKKMEKERREIVERVRRMEREKRKKISLSGVSPLRFSPFLVFVFVL